MNPFLKIDHLLDSRCFIRRTLCPGKDHATSFGVIGVRMLDLLQNQAKLEYSAEAVSEIVHGVMDHFPENIFWDFDYIVWKIIENAIRSESDFERSIDLTKENFLNIFSIFGRHSTIKFRYIHDFIYGYDWLKWMLEKKRPGDNPDPYGFDFLDYISLRGVEMISLIKENDKNYPELNGAYRNPFLHSRSDEDEIILMTDLALTGNIPIEAWNQQTNLKWDRNYSLIRHERSKQMGIGRNELPGSHKI